MNMSQTEHNDLVDHKKLAELALKDPVVRFAVEHYGAQVIGVDLCFGEVDAPVHNQDSGEEEIQKLEMAIAK